MKRRPVRTETCNEDDTLRLAHLLHAIARRSSSGWARELLRRAFAFNGQTVVISDGHVVEKPNTGGGAQ